MIITLIFLYRHTGNGAVIARSSQPEVGWLGWRSSDDEDFLKALADACSYDRGDSTGFESPDSEIGDEPVRAPPPKVRKKKKSIVTKKKRFFSCFFLTF